jgi:hypothetical protein
MQFITFASCNYIDAGNRLLNQASKLNVFDNVCLYTEKDLEGAFWDKHGQFIMENPKGFGYWIWKPYLIKKKMDEMNDGDILLYLDSGCEIDCSERDYFIDYIEQVKKDYILGTLGKTIVEESCKMDLLLYIGIDDSFLATKMHQAGANLIYINSETRNLINEWYDLSCNYYFINDDKSQESSLFKEHRHDQSIYSLLTKKYNIYSQHTLDKCVKYIRNRTGVSKL